MTSTPTPSPTPSGERDPLDEHGPWCGTPCGRPDASGFHAYNRPAYLTPRPETHWMPGDSPVPSYVASLPGYTPDVGDVVTHPDHGTGTVRFFDTNGEVGVVFGTDYRHTTTMWFSRFALADLTDR